MASTTVSAKSCVYIPRILSHFNVEISDIASYFGDITIAHDLNVWMAPGFQHFRSQDSDSTIIGWKRAIHLGHASSD